MRLGLLKELLMMEDFGRSDMTGRRLIVSKNCLVTGTICSG